MERQRAQPGPQVGAWTQAVAIAALWTALPAAGAAPMLEVGAAWHGQARPGRALEAVARVSGADAGSARLEFRAAGERVMAVLPLASGRAAQLAVPLPGPGPWTVRAQLPGGAVLERPVAIALTERPLVASAVPIAALANAPLLVDEAAMPSHAAGYAAIDALVVDGPLLGAVTAAQLQALVGAVTHCLRLVGVGLSAEAQALVQRTAGCGGSGLAFVASASDVPAALTRLFGRPLPEPPAPESLAALAPDDGGLWSGLVVGLAAYLIAAALAVAFAPRVLAASVALALGATVAAFAVLALLPAQTRVAALAEATSGDHVASVEAVWLVADATRGRRALTLPALLGRPRPCPGAHLGDVSWSWDPRAGRYTDVAADARLLGTRAVCFSTEFPVERAVSVTRDPDALRLRNDGTGSLPAGTALANGRRYALPPLAPGAEARLERTQSEPAASPLEQLALERAPLGLVWPLARPAIGEVDRRTAVLLLTPAEPPP